MPVIKDAITDIIAEMQDTRYVMMRISRQKLPVQCSENIKKVINILGKANRELHEIEKDMSADQPGTS